MALHLARPKQRLHSNPSLIHLFSSSSSPPQNENESIEQASQSPSSSSSSPSSSSSSPSDSKMSSYFSTVKSSLKQKPQTQFSRFDSNAQNPSGNQIGGEFQDLRRNLTTFKRRSEATPARDLQDLYKQNVLSKSGDGLGSRFENIKENLRQMRPQGNNNIESKWSNLATFQSISKKPIENFRQELPISVFGKELEEGKRKEDESEEMKSEFLKFYDTKELGEKLRLFRPEGMKEEGWFSLKELNQRLVKLREVEEEEIQRTRKGAHFVGLRSGIAEAHNKEQAKKASAFQKLDLLSVFSETPQYLLEPPKEELVETYFHPDNMSSAEKMKIELAKVREEFKMSESDCGSARVQVAQLTTKIKHLSSVLHKKDKHSRKGLLAMVQRRKKLLKYMRRTDWDSYCISLSKLGLRDNPDYKF